jgi:hypothetical protein
MAKKNKAQKKLNIPKISIRWVLPWVLPINYNTPKETDSSPKWVDGLTNDENNKNSARNKREDGDAKPDP